MDSVNKKLWLLALREGGCVYSSTEDLKQSNKEYWVDGWACSPHIFIDSEEILRFATESSKIDWNKSSTLKELEAYIFQGTDLPCDSFKYLLGTLYFESGNFYHWAFVCNFNRLYETLLILDSVDLNRESEVVRESVDRLLGLISLDETSFYERRGHFIYY